ncbi:MAG: acyl carrier protein [Thiobacillaceae bacterium]|nr:acyl carrier protein [Thiobacillaceae bacterium]MDW8324738.1 acyl carrier protein [Burkholderiales bacterium]
MDEKPLGQSVLEIMRTVLKQPQLTLQAKRQEVPQWDSLRHVELMFALEDAFGVEFTAEELALLDSGEAIAAVLVEKGHAA